MNFKRNMLFTGLCLASSLSFAGGRGPNENMMDAFLQLNIPEGFEAPEQTEANTPQLAPAEARPTIDATGQSMVFHIDGIESSTVRSQFNTDFSLTNTLNHIITSRGNTNTTANSLLDSMALAFDDGSGTGERIVAHQSVNADMSIAIRPEDASRIKSFKDSAVNAIPTAVFNRFDLASTNGQDCGEYRVVYNSRSDFGIIFEARIPNPKKDEPQLSDRLFGCAPVVNFWKNLNGMDEGLALAALQEFFYTGVTVDGVVLPAALDFDHFTPNTGQVRTNTFAAGPVPGKPWMLREFKTVETNGDVKFALDTVKDNPLASLYQSTTEMRNQVVFEGTSSERDALAAEYLNSFQQFFLDNSVAELLSPEITAHQTKTSLTTNDMITGVRLMMANSFNEFESFADGKDKVSTKFTGDCDSPSDVDPFNCQIEQRIDDLLTGTDFEVTVDQLLARADAMSCGGCHSTANRVSIGTDSANNDVIWPNASSFLHVSQRGQLSSALTASFLPKRRDLLENFLDIDNDGRLNEVDNCPTVANSGQFDRDNDSFGNECDPDIDGDGFSNEIELSKGTKVWDAASFPRANSSLDLDGDGFENNADNCPTVANKGQWDKDKDGLGNECDNDIDGDGFSNEVELAQNTKVWDATSFPSDPSDTDGDGIKDDVDNCPDASNSGQWDKDKDGIGNECDFDIDGDGVSNVIEIARGTKVWDASSFPNL